MAQSESDGHQVVEEVVSTRGQHTPTMRAASIIRALEGHFAAQFPEWESGYEKAFLAPIWTEQPEPVDGDHLALGVWLSESDDGIELRKTFTQEQFAVMVGTAYAVQAIKAERAGNLFLAWDYAVDAAQWEAYLSGVAGQAPSGGGEDDQEILQRLNAFECQRGHNAGQREATTDLYLDLKARNPKMGPAKLADLISMAIGSHSHPEKEAVSKVFTRCEADRSKFSVIETGELITRAQLRARIKDALRRESDCERRRKGG